jgi:hypothetical protein
MAEARVAVNVKLWQRSEGVRHLFADIQTTAEAFDDGYYSAGYCFSLPIQVDVGDEIEISRVDIPVRTGL